MNDPSEFRPRQRDVQRHFDRIGAGFDDADVVHRVTGDGLLDRLRPMQIEPTFVVDLGSATGTLSRQLARRFRRSRIISVDLSMGMLREVQRRRSWFSPERVLQANAEQLPFVANSIDIIVANQLLPWLGTSSAVFKDVARVLRPEGLFAFSSLGPDSLGNLRAAFDDGEAHVQRFADMHDVGDALVRAGLKDPVLDVDRLELSYRDTGALYRDLHRCGGNALPGRRKTLTGKDRFRRADRLLRTACNDGGLQVRLELVYGHAWGSDIVRRDGEVRIDVAELRGRRRHR